MSTISFQKAFAASSLIIHVQPSSCQIMQKLLRKALKFFTRFSKIHLLSGSFPDQQIEWRFIPKRTPWYGGFWERLVGMAKDALSKILGRTKPTLSAFRAIVADAEVALNDCPLENPSSIVNDEEFLSSAHLMYGRINTLPYNKETDEEKFVASYGDKPDELKKAIIRHQTLLQKFKKRFLSSYLPVLREYHQSTRKSHSVITKLYCTSSPNCTRSKSPNRLTNQPEAQTASFGSTFTESPSRPTRKCAAQTNAAIKKIFEQEKAE